MGLATSTSGDGILVSHDTEIREFTVFLAGIGTKYRVTKSTVIREWVAVTQAAAQAKIDSPDSPPSGTTYSYNMAETNRVVGAYKLTRTAISETAEVL